MSERAKKSAQELPRTETSSDCTFQRRISRKFAAIDARGGKFAARPGRVVYVRSPLPVPAGLGKVNLIRLDDQQEQNGGTKVVERPLLPNQLERSAVGL